MTTLFEEVLGLLTTYNGVSFLNADADLSWQKMPKMEDEETVEEVADGAHLSGRVKEALKPEKEKANSLLKKYEESANLDEAKQLEIKEALKITKISLARDLEYFATEKIDGCNWSCVLVIESGKIINAGVFKRSAQIKDEKELYVGSISIIKKYIAQFQKLAHNLFESKEFNIDEKQISVTLFGEFFGPGIIDRINYPKQDLSFYSMVLNGKRLRFTETRQLLMNAQLPVVPIAMRGTFREIYDWFQKSDRKIASLCINNHKDVANQKNYMEGIVFHPVIAGNIMKCRSMRFLEVKAKAQASQASAMEASAKKDKGIHLSREQIDKLVPFLDKTAISNRISNYISKVGPMTFKQDIDKSINEVIDDMISSIPDIDERSQKWMRNSAYKNVSLQCRALLAPIET